MRVIPALCAFLLGALPSVALAAEGHSAGFINFDKGLIIQAVNFILLMILLTKLLYKPLVSKMEERTQAIKKSLDEAQAARAEAQRERQEHAAKIQAAHAELTEDEEEKEGQEARFSSRPNSLVTGPRRIKPGRPGLGASQGLVRKRWQGWKPRHA
jgi:predicted nuclease with TOPRIM domain